MDSREEWDEHPRWVPYTQQKIQLTESHLNNMHNTARRYGSESGTRTAPTVQTTGASCAPSETQQDGIDMFPRLMDDGLKIRLMAHPLVESVIIFLLPRIAARMERPSWRVLNAELDTYGITLVGIAEGINAYTYSMDPFFTVKKEEHEKAMLNANRKRKYEEMMEGTRQKIAVDPPVPRNDDLFGYAGIDSRMNRDVSNPNSSSSSNLNSQMDEDQQAMSAWAGASEEDVQSFVDDRLRIIIYGIGVAPVRIRAFRFILGRPIED